MVNAEYQDTMEKIEIKILHNKGSYVMWGSSSIWKRGENKSDGFSIRCIKD